MRHRRIIGSLFLSLLTTTMLTPVAVNAAVGGAGAQLFPYELRT